MSAEAEKEEPKFLDMSDVRPKGERLFDRIRLVPPYNPPARRAEPNGEYGGYISWHVPWWEMPFSDRYLRRVVVPSAPPPQLKYPMVRRNKTHCLFRELQDLMSRIPEPPEPERWDEI